MKIIGLITAWYVEDWIELAIQQALRYCDEVVVSVGPNTPLLESLEDTTREKTLQYKDKIKLVDTVKGDTFSVARCQTLNNMLDASEFCDAGNWIWMLDADEFYFDDTYDEVVRVIQKGQHDSITMEAKFFYINMTRYLHSRHDRLFRIGEPNCRFQPTQKWPLGKRYVLRCDVAKKGMFHYSLLLNTRLRELQWRTEYQSQKSQPSQKQARKIQWMNEIYMRYDLDDEDRWLDKNHHLFGLRAPFYNDDFTAGKDGKPFVYNGPQPDLVEQSPLALVRDFRCGNR